MNSFPRFASLVIALLLILDAFFVSYAIGLNLRTIHLVSNNPVQKTVLSAPGPADSSKYRSSNIGAGSSSKTASFHSATSAVSSGASSASGGSSIGATDGSASSHFQDLEKTEQRLVPTLKAAANAGVLDPAADNMFHPNDPVTRADFTRWMVRIKQLPSSDSSLCSYQDVAQSNPYFKDIETATAALMVQGYPIKGSKNKDFKPKQNITRQEFAVMYCTFSGKRSRAERLTAKEIADDLRYDAQQGQVSSVPYKDEGGIDDWARKWVAVAEQSGVINESFDCNPASAADEKRFLRPQRSMTRAEAVHILVKLFGISANKCIKDSN